MRITADTHVVLRAVLSDDDAQRASASDALNSAESMAVSVHALREFAWVLERSYGAPRRAIAEAFRRSMDTANVVLHRQVVEDHEHGSDNFVSFDKRVVKLLAGQGAN